MSEKVEKRKTTTIAIYSDDRDIVLKAQELSGEQNEGKMLSLAEVIHSIIHAESNTAEYAYKFKTWGDLLVRINADTEFTVVEKKVMDEYKNHTCFTMDKNDVVFTPSPEVRELIKKKLQEVDPNADLTLEASEKNKENWNTLGNGAITYFLNNLDKIKTEKQNG